MNCRPGDLAIVVRCPNKRVEHHLGMVVRLGANLVYDYFGVACWKLASPIKDDRYMRGAVLEAIADRDLRPIRDNDGEDETLIWAPKREPINA